MLSGRERERLLSGRENAFSQRTLSGRERMFSGREKVLGKDDAALLCKFRVPAAVWGTFFFARGTRVHNPSCFTLVMLLDVHITSRHKSQKRTLTTPCSLFFLQLGDSLSPSMLFVACRYKHVRMWHATYVNLTSC